MLFSFLSFQISSLFLIRIVTIVLFHVAALYLSIAYIKFTGSYIGIYSGLSLSFLPLVKPSGSSNNTGFIPWKITSSSINAQNALIKFYSWLGAESPIKLFIDTHCLHLLKRDPGFLGQEHTGITTSLFTVDLMLSNSKLKDCANLKTAENAFDDIDSSYIYFFINKISRRFYIGSTINPVSRLHNYIHSWTYARQGLLNEMRTIGGGFCNYYFYPGFKIPNYLNLFTELNPHVKIDAKSMFILNCFSEFHVRLLEQSIISYLKPEINDLNVAVSYNFTAINIEDFNPKIWENSHKISVFDREGNLFNSYDSINKAKSALGLTEFGIRWNRNRADQYVLCPKPNLYLRIVDETIQTISSSAPLASFEKLVPIIGINLEEIPEGFIYAYLDDKETLFGVFRSASEFALANNLNPWQAFRYINKEKEIPVEGGILSVFLCCNPLHRENLLNIQDKKNWPVVSIDTLDNDMVRFHDNPNAARAELSSLLGISDLKPTRSFTQSYITGPTRNGQITTPSKFKKRFKLLWFKDYIKKDS